MCAFRKSIQTQGLVEGRIWKGLKEGHEHRACAARILDPQTHPAFLVSKAYCGPQAKPTCSQHLPFQ